MKGLVVWNDLGSGSSPRSSSKELTTGVIDLDSGVYSQKTVFDRDGVSAGSGVDQQYASSLSVGRALSPDLTKLAALRTACRSNCTAESNDVLSSGWIDGSGRFSDVTPDVKPTADAFEQKTSSKPIGFDENGFFYFMIIHGEEGVTYRLAPGKREISDRVIVPNAGIGNLHLTSVGGFTFGTPNFETFGCTINGERRGWISATQYAVVVTSAMGKDSIVAVPPGGGLGNCGADSTTVRRIVPEIEDDIDSPRGNSDGSQIVFRVKRASNSCDLYTVAAAGGSPKKLGVTGVDVCSIQIGRWR